MKATWDPEDGSPKQVFELDPDDLLSSESIAIERAYGGSLEEWLQGLRKKEAKARRILLWHHLKQINKRLRIEDTPDFRMRQMTVEMNSKELQALLDDIKMRKMDPDIQEAAIGAIEHELRKAMEQEGGVLLGEVLEADPKATLVRPSRKS